MTLKEVGEVLKAERERRYISVDEVMNKVADGTCDAGAVYSGAFANAVVLGVKSSRLRLLAVAGQTPWDVVCASPELPSEQADRVKQALLEFDVQHHLGRELLSEIFRLDGFVEPRTEDFGPLERAAAAEGILER